MEKLSRAKNREKALGEVLFAFAAYASAKTDRRGERAAKRGGRNKSAKTKIACGFQPACDFFLRFTLLAARR